MKKSLLFVLCGCSLLFLNACGGGTTQVSTLSNGATHFVVSAPAAANIGSVFSFTVTAIDAGDNLATSYSGTVRFTSTDGHAALPASSTLVGGMGTFSATLETVGSQTITATDMVKTTITGATSSISVSAGATHFSVTAPPTAVSGTAFNFTVSALDGSNNPVASYAGTAQFTSTDGQAALSSNSTLTNGTGSFTATLKTAGSQTVTATDMATTSITGTSNSIQVSATASGFTPTGSMGTARYSHTATLLCDLASTPCNNNKVLVTGGLDANRNALAEAELFDPGTGIFSPAGKMVNARSQHTATLLDTGKVLVTGTTAAAELFDPATESFSATGTMATARLGHTATLLNSGKVLITGGSNRGYFALAELFDPSNGTFAASGSLITARSLHTATLLKDGKVLVAGGLDSNGQALATAELFDPNSGSFTATGSMTIARASHTATLLKDGKVLIAGPDQTAELFDPNSGSFAATGGMTTAPARNLHTATLLNDGTVLAAGGEYFSYGGLCSGQFPNSTATSELFDPASGSFTATSDMTAMRSSHTATLLTSGEVLVTGGIGWTYVLLPSNCYKMTVTVEASAELYK